MINRRNFLAAGAALALAACGDPVQLLDANLASSIRVTEATATTTVTRTDTALPKDQIVETARAMVEAALQAGPQTGGRAVRAEMEVSRFFISNPVAGALLGSSQSSINTNIKLVHVSTGAVVKETFAVFGLTEPRPTIFGAIELKAHQKSWTL